MGLRLENEFFHTSHGQWTRPTGATPAGDDQKDLQSLN